MIHVIPEGKVGNYKIEHITVSEEDSMFTALRGGNSFVSPGKYCQLNNGWDIIMSDTGHERRSNLDVVWKSNGNVLIAGLGIGMIILPIAEKEEVSSITVIEKSSEVIELVEPHLRNAMWDPHKLKIVQADIFEWKPDKGVKYDTIYFDIWYNMCTDNLKSISKLNRKFARCLNRDNYDSWRGAWVENMLRSKKKKEDRDHKRYSWRW